MHRNRSFTALNLNPPEQLRCHGRFHGSDQIDLGKRSSRCVRMVLLLQHPTSVTTVRCRSISRERREGRYGSRPRQGLQRTGNKLIGELLISKFVLVSVWSTAHVTGALCDHDCIHSGSMREEAPHESGISRYLTEIHSVYPHVLGLRDLHTVRRGVAIRLWT